MTYRAPGRPCRDVEYIDAWFLSPQEILPGLSTIVQVNFLVDRGLGGFLVHILRPRY